MYGAMARLVDELDLQMSDPEVVSWACPVPFFGRITEASVATVGINPSNREFVDTDGSELGGNRRRLPTLGSLALDGWAQATGADVRSIARSCLDYFDRNPYRLWFDVLERMLAEGGHSYYSGRRAAHLDLVPYATSVKWGALPGSVRSRLVSRSRRTLAEIIRDSPVEVLVLNGRSVVNEFMASAQTDLTMTAMPAWNLPRFAGKSVPGIRYSGALTSMGGVDFDRVIQVVGFNHNLQSSFGVTKTVTQRIAKEVGEIVDRSAASAAG